MLLSFLWMPEVLKTKGTLGEWCASHSSLKREHYLFPAESRRRLKMRHRISGKYSSRKSSMNIQAALGLCQLMQHGSQQHGPKAGVLVWKPGLAAALRLSLSPPTHPPPPELGLSNCVMAVIAPTRWHCREAQVSYYTWYVCARSIWQELFALLVTLEFTRWLGASRPTTPLHRNGFSFGNSTSPAAAVLCLSVRFPLLWLNPFRLSHSLTVPPLSLTPRAPKDGGLGYHVRLFPILSTHHVLPVGADVLAAPEAGATSLVATPLAGPPHAGSRWPVSEIQRYPFPLFLPHLFLYEMAYSFLESLD